MPTVSQKPAVNKRKSVSSIAIISGNEIVQISMRDNIKTLYIKLSLHYSKSFHAAPTRMQR